MHEVSLGGTIRDYLTGEQLERLTYEDLRQAMARFLVEERGFSPERLTPRYPVVYCIDAVRHERAADIAAFNARGELCLLVMFCPGQIHTYARELTAMARLALPCPSPLAVVTDMRQAELFVVASGEILAEGLRALPPCAEVEALAAVHAFSPPDDERRARESRILHAYTGLGDKCCGKSCPAP